MMMSLRRSFRLGDVILFCSSVGTVFSLGLYEVRVCPRDSGPMTNCYLSFVIFWRVCVPARGKAALVLADPLANIKLAATYASVQVWPSTAWDTVPMETVARLHNLSPETVCREFGSSAADAADQVTIKYIQTSRFVIASFMAVTQFVRSVRLGMESSTVFRDKILRGTVPMLPGPRERVLRLGGYCSYVALEGLYRHGQAMLPILEQPEEQAVEAIKRYWRGGRLPVAWSVRPFEYGRLYTWRELLHPHSGNFTITTDAGQRLLYMEADCTNSTELLNIAGESRDLSVNEAFHAFHAIKTVSHENGIPLDGAMRVLLVDTLQGLHAAEKQNNTAGRRPSATGLPLGASSSGAATTLNAGGGPGIMASASAASPVRLRGEVAGNAEVDVVLDATAPVLLALVRWCEDVTEGNFSIPIVFETSNVLYFRVVAHVLAAHGFTVLDRSEHTDLPRLIHETDAYQAVSVLHTRLRSGCDRCCVLLHHRELLRDELAAMKATVRAEMAAIRGNVPRPDLPFAAGISDSFRVLCSATIHDDLFAQVRTWVRQGVPASVIQREVDERFSGIVEAMLMAAREVGLPGTPSPPPSPPPQLAPSSLS
jgi:hypothetical protein